MRYSPLLLLCFALSAPTLAAKTIPVRGQGFSVTIPDDWTVVKRPNVVLVAAAPGQTTALGILVSTNGDQRQADTPDYIRGMAQGMLNRASTSGSAMQIIDAGPRSLNGVPAGFVQARQSFPDHRVMYSQVYTIAANGKFYVLTFDARDPHQDGALATIAGSFRFDQPPELPGPNDFVVHRMGEVGGSLLILGLAVFLIRLIYQRYGKS